MPKKSPHGKGPRRRPADLRRLLRGVTEGLPEYYHYVGPESRKFVADTVKYLRKLKMPKEFIRSPHVMLGIQELFLKAKHNYKVSQLRVRHVLRKEQKKPDARLWPKTLEELKRASISNTIVELGWNEMKRLEPRQRSRLAWALNQFLLLREEMLAAPPHSEERTQARNSLKEQLIEMNNLLKTEARIRDEEIAEFYTNFLTHLASRLNELI